MNGSATVVVLALAGVAGGLAGYILNRCMSWLLEEIRMTEISHSSHVQDSHESESQSIVLVILLGSATAVGVVWWEVISHGLLVQNVIGPSTTTTALALASYLSLRETSSGSEAVYVARHRLQRAQFIFNPRS